MRYLTMRNWKVSKHSLITIDELTAMLERLILPLQTKYGFKVMEFYVPKKWLRRYLFFCFKRYNGFIHQHSAEEVYNLYTVAKFFGKVRKEKKL